MELKAALGLCQLISWIVPNLRETTGCEPRVIGELTGRRR